MIECLGEQPQVDYYYDPRIRKTILLGNTAYLGALSSPYATWTQELVDRDRLAITDEEAFNDDGVYPLPQMLGDDSISAGDHEIGLFRGVSPERCLVFGRWVFSEVIKQDPERNLDMPLIERANALGVGPSIKQLTDRFYNLSKYYIETGIPNSQRKYQFSGWSDQRFINYLRSIGEAPHTPPSMRHMIDLSKDNIDQPSYAIIADRFEGANNALELAGYWVIPKWDNDDYVELGLQYKLANAGITPKARDLSRLSSTGLSPGHSIVAKRFVKISHFTSAVDKRYAEYITERQILASGLDRFKQKYGELFNGSIGKLPQDTDRDLSICARFVLLKNLPGFNKLPYEVTTKLCKRTVDLDFIPTLACMNRGLSIKDIKTKARELELYSFVSSMSRHRELLVRAEEEII